MSDPWRDGARGVLNLCGAYVLAAILLFVIVAITYTGPGEPGPSVMEYVVFGIGMLPFGAPVLLVTLVLLDRWIRSHDHPRRTVVLAVIAPGITALLLLPVVEFGRWWIGLVAWTVALGVAYGFTLRMRERARQ